MLQERLNGLAMRRIEKDIMDNVDLGNFLKDLASRNARKSIFVKHRSIIVDGVTRILFLFEVIILVPLYYI